MFAGRLGRGVLAGLTFAAAVAANIDRAKAGTEPFFGDIIAVAYTYCPRGWAEANGALLPISQNTALFSLYGTTFGGDGRTTFGLPDLRGRKAMNHGHGPGLSVRTMGEKLGSETQVLTAAQLPAHNHRVNANNLDGDKAGPGGKILAAAPPGGSGSETIYSQEPPNRTMASSMIAPSGSSFPVNIQDPVLALRYCVALVGIYPSRS